MYTGWTREKQNNEWVRGTSAFLDQAFGPAARGSIRMRCPCSQRKNKKWRERRIVMQDLFKNGYVRNYTRWVHHGEPVVIRQESVRPILEELDADAGMADMFEDFQ
jgi:hypothetical protein